MLKKKNLSLICVIFAIFFIIGVAPVAINSSSRKFNNPNCRISSDDTPLKLENFYYDPTIIYVSASSDSIMFTLHVISLSGFTNGRFRLVSPSGIQSKMGYIHYPRELISGDDLNGIYETTIEFPQFSEEGVWFIEYVELFDDASNWLDLYENDLSDLGFPTKIDIISDPDDTTPPNLEDFRFFPSVIVTGEGSQEVIFTATITDDLSGFSYGRFRLVSPSGLSRMGYFHYPRELISGDDLNGIYETTIEFPQFSEEGVWFIEYVELYDNVGNWVDLYETDLISLSFPTKIKIVYSVEEAVEEIIEDVEELDLQGGSEQSLVLKLEGAQFSIENERSDVAIRQLNAFIIQVEVMRGKKLTDGEADALISAAQLIIDNLVNNSL